MKSEIITLNKERNVTLTCYIQEANGEFGFSKRPAIVVLPGGGYAMCSDREADPIALAYSAAGYQAFVLRYTVKTAGAWPDPLNDYEQAVKIIKDKSEEWHLDPEKIAVVGFSAGGHLAACAATLAINKPAAAILVYPAILKDIVDMCQPNMPYPNEHVGFDTCPCFFAATRDDKIVNIKNTLQMQLALTNFGITFESHIYSYGNHGFSTGQVCLNGTPVSSRVQDWLKDSITWLNEVLGELTNDGFTEATVKNDNANYKEYLSIDCTLEHINKQSAETKGRINAFYEILSQAATAKNYTLEGVNEALKHFTLKELMMMLKVDNETIKRTDDILKGIKNERKQYD